MYWFIASEPLKSKFADANGVILTSSGFGNRFMFTGREYDAETGLYYYRARFYNPYIGRFMQTDPIGYYDSMNLYEYCWNNPINWVDPWGLKPQTIITRRKINSRAEADSYNRHSSLGNSSLGGVAGAAAGLAVTPIGPLGAAGVGLGVGVGVGEGLNAATPQVHPGDTIETTITWDPETCHGTGDTGSDMKIDQKVIPEDNETKKGSSL